MSSARRVVRAATRADAAAIRALALDNEMFAPDEMGDFDGMLEGYFDGTLPGHQWRVATVGDAVVAAAYVAPEPFADRVWNLYFIAVDRAQHGAGHGAALIAEVETDLRTKGDDQARVLIVETSSTDAFAGARAFYDRQGFTLEARVREFYGPGDDKVVFWKSLLD